jgi:hypothetical protein
MVRAFYNLIRLTALVLLPIQAPAAAPLPNADPRTVLQGDQVIDAAIALVKAQHPGVKLKTGIEGYVVHDVHETKAARAKRFSNPHLARALSPGPNYEVGNLLFHLHNGTPITLRDPIGHHKLADWIYDHPDRSVLPHELLAQAIQIHDGNTLRALTDIWNTLSPNWQAAATRNANGTVQKLYDVTGEFNLRDGAGHYVITNKARDPLAPIEAKIKFLVTKRGDVFSTYYHFFGAMLYSHYVAAKTGSALTGKLAGRLAVLLEGKLYRKTSGLALEREKRILNDIAGADAGARLRVVVSDPARLSPPPPTAAGALPTYLRPDPRLSGEYLLEADGRAPVHFRSDADEKFRRGPMSVEELKLRFEYAVTQNEEIFNPYILATSSDGERMQTGLQLYVKGGAGDPELNAWIQKFRSGWRGPAKAEVDFSLYSKSVESHLPGERKYDLQETLRRVERQMDLALAKNNLPLIGPPPAVTAPPGPPKGNCRQLYELLTEIVKTDRQRRH